MSFEVGALLLAWVAILILALALSGLVRQVRAMSLQPRVVRIEPNGAAGKRLSVSPSALADYRGVADDRRPGILLFVTSNCKPCQARLRDLESIAAEVSGTVSITALFRQTANGYRSSHVTILENQEEVFGRVPVPLTPFGVVLASDGLVTHARPVGSRADVLELVQAARLERDDATT